MSWLFESRRITTKQNGPMSLTRFFGRWILRSSDFTQQSSPYMDALWRKTLRAVTRRQASVRRCLVLGVGFGGIFKEVRSVYPDAEIIGVDWDAELAELGKKLGILHLDTKMGIVLGDAADVVPSLDGVFDLVIVDMFVEQNLAPILYDAAFQDALIKKVAPGGLVCVNGYNKYAVFPSWKSKLHALQMVRYKMNDVWILKK